MQALRNEFSFNATFSKMGVEHELIARQMYECEIQKRCPNIRVVESGLWIDTER